MNKSNAIGLLDSRGLTNILLVVVLGLMIYMVSGTGPATESALMTPTTLNGESSAIPVMIVNEPDVRVVGQVSTY